MTALTLTLPPTARRILVQARDRIVWAAVLGAGLAVALWRAVPGDRVALAYITLLAGAFFIGGLLIGLLLAFPTTSPQKNDVGRLQPSDSPADFRKLLLGGLATLSLVKFQELLGFADSVLFYLTIPRPVSPSTLVSKGVIGGLALALGGAGLLIGLLYTRLRLSPAIARADWELGRFANSAAASFVEKAPTTEGNNLGPLLTGSTDALRAVADLPIEENETARDYALWARANLQLGRYEAAVTGYRKASVFAPKDARIHAELGLALLKSGNSASGLASLKDAKAYLSDESPPDLRRDIYKWLSYGLLYQPVATGAAAVIPLIEDDYLRHRDALISGGILVNLACARGQALGQALDVGLTVEAEAHRQAALKTIRIILALRPVWRTRLIELAGLPSIAPTNATLSETAPLPAATLSLSTNEDRDLESLARDTEFQSIVEWRTPRNSSSTVAAVSADVATATSAETPTTHKTP